MKTKYVLFSTALTIALTLPMFGQHNHDDMTKAEMKKHDMSSMMGKPTVDATVEGLHMKVWLMTQKKHKEMMKGKMGQMMMDKDMKEMKQDDMEMDKATKETMMAGTHCIMLDVSDVAGKEGTSDANAKVMIVSPSKKHTSVDLKSMMNHFGSGLTLAEKGKYQLTVSANVNGVSKTKHFQYVVK
jgi:hypothetical protein